MLSQSTIFLAIAATASAHMTMMNPEPFNNATLTSSPLTPADFPCKQRTGVYDIKNMNQWDAGTTQDIYFKGTAVHGGGSCQFSITTDAEPTEKSQWKVIQSVIGGCPANNPSGNFAEAADPTNSKDPMNLKSAHFPVTMPKDMPDGRYTFAWTWFNQMGNREFYMNCAPVQVGSSSSKASASAASVLSALPDMFVANLPATECSTTEGEDFEFPNPGKNVIDNKTGKAGSKLVGTGCTTQTKKGAGSGQIGSPSAGTPSQGPPSKVSSIASQPQASQKPAYSAAPPNKGPVESKAPINPGGVFAPGASSIAVAGPTAQPTPPAAKPSAPAVQAAPSAAPEQPSTPNTTTPTNGDCTPCTNDGGVVCIGNKQFGLCNRGCAVAQDLAAGMSCSSGAIVASTKRHLHFPRAHLHRRLSAARLV
jgi:hypothetical protein